MKTLLVLLASGVSAFAGTIFEIQPQSLATVPATFNGSGRVGYYTNADPAGRLLFVEFGTKPGYGYTAYYSFTGPGKWVLQKPVYTETTNTMERLEFFPQVVWVQVVEIPPVVVNRSVKYTAKGLTNGVFWVQWMAVAGQAYDISVSYMTGPAVFPVTDTVTAETSGPMVAKSIGGFPQVFMHVEPAASYPMPPPVNGGTPLGPVKTTLKTNTVIVVPKLAYPPPPQLPRSR